MLKVVTVVGTRPEIIRLSEVIKKFDKSFKHFLVHTGQNYDYELNEIFFDDLGLRKPDYFLNSASDTAVRTISNILTEIEKILLKLNPDVFFVLGDTNSCISSYVAKRLKIPVFHYEAGNRCFDQRVPEELNRKIVDHIADINLTYSKISKNYLISESFPANRVICVGSPMMEVLNASAVKISKSNILEKLELSQKNFFLVSLHREENIDSNDSFNRIVKSLNLIAKKYDKKILFSAHPRTQLKLSEKNVKLDKRISVIKPLGLSDYCKLQKESLAVISDSGTIYEESSILGFDAISPRETQERPEAMENCHTIMSGLEPSDVLNSIEIIIQRKDDYSIVVPDDYNVEKVSDKIVNIIQSYHSFVNREVWKKY